MTLVRSSNLPWRYSPILGSLLVLAATCDVEARQAGSLPGAEGPRVEMLAAPSKSIELLWLAVVGDFSQVGDSPKQADREKSLPQMLPSGAEALQFLIDLKQRPPSGTVISIDVVGKSGPIKFPRAGLMKDLQTPSGEVRVVIERKPETGYYTDGPYSATVTIDDKAVARLNWSIGAAQSAVRSEQPRRFEGVSNSGNPLVDKDGRALALYMDPSRDTVPPAPVAEAEALLTAVASEGTALLAKLEPAKLVLKLDRPMLGGAPLRRFLIIAVYPRIGSTGGGRLRTLVTFSPGNTRVIQEITAKFGPARETEVWSSAITRQAGLDSNVSWWGPVGAATAEDGSITHVLIRQAVDLN